MRGEGLQKIRNSLRRGGAACSPYVAGTVEGSARSVLIHSLGGPCPRVAACFATRMIRAGVKAFAKQTGGELAVGTIRVSGWLGKNEMRGDNHHVVFKHSFGVITNTDISWLLPELQAHNLRCARLTGLLGSVILVIMHPYFRRF